MPNDATKVVAYIFVNRDKDLEEASYSVTARNWLYRSPGNGYGVFDCADNPGTWTHVDTPELDEFVLVSEFSINLANLPAIDCIHQLPEVVASVVPDWEESILEVK